MVAAKGRRYLIGLVESSRRLAYAERSDRLAESTGALLLPELHVDENGTFTVTVGPTASGPNTLRTTPGTAALFCIAVGDDLSSLLNDDEPVTAAERHTGLADRRAAWIARETINRLAPPDVAPPEGTN